MSEFHPIQTLQPWLERAWMDRYLARELTEPESDWWEAYILTHPHLAAELEADEAVRAHTVAAGAALTAADASEGPAASGRASADKGRSTNTGTDAGTNDRHARTTHAGRRYTWQQVAATALILVLSAAALPQYLRKPPDVMPVDVYTLNTERSGGEPEWIIEDNGGADSEWVVIQLPGMDLLDEIRFRDSGVRIPMSGSGQRAFITVVVKRASAHGVLELSFRSGEKREAPYLTVPHH